MEDQHLGRLLRELPREQARQGFTARVLARLDHASNKTPPRGVRWQPRLAAVAATLVLALAVGGLLQYSRKEAERAARVARAEQTLRALRAEHGRIKKEIEALPESPVIYLGGDERTDLVIDMREVESRDGVRPATYRYDTF